VPMGALAPLGMSADSILLIYVLTLCGISTLLAALAAGSTYSLVGMSREMMAMMTLEPLLAISVIIGAMHTSSLRLDVVFGGSAMYAVGTGGFPYAGILMGVVMLFAFQAFVGRMPFDIAEAETELIEGTLIEYSGPKLALFKYAQMAKLFIYSAIFVALFIPWGNSLAFPLGTLVVVAKILGLTLLVTLVAATHARYRIDQAIKYYAFLFVVALIALILAVLGY
jgi:formate hydrogenlyase subunit 4